MKKIGLIILIMSLLISLVPQTVQASEVSEVPETNETTSYDQDLTQYLNKVSTARGFDVTKDELIKTLTYYNLTLENFQAVDEIDQFLGEVITPDYSNLSGIYERYDLDQTSLTQLLNEYGDDLNDYIYVYDLYRAVNFYTNYNKSENQPELNTQMIANLMNTLSQFGLSDLELQNIEDHFINIADELSSTQVQIQLKNLSNNMMSFATKAMENSVSDENYKPSDAEINEFISLYNELLSIVKLNVVFNLSNNGALTPVSIQELIKMDDLKDADLKIELYNTDSVLLADLSISGDMLGSEIGTIVDNADNSVVDKVDNNKVQTVKGGKLPKTAGNYIPNTIYGLFTALFGLLIYRKVRNA